MELTKSLDNDCKNILLVGHNPHISYFAEHLTNAEIGVMEPAGLVSVRFEILKWENVEEGIGSFENYTYPSALE